MSNQHEVKKSNRIRQFRKKGYYERKIGHFIVNADMMDHVGFNQALLPLLRSEINPSKKLIHCKIKYFFKRAPTPTPIASFLYLTLR